MQTTRDINDQQQYLSILSQAMVAEVKRFADTLIPLLDTIDVLSNRTGLMMVPMIDSAQGASFYVGEVLVAEARVRVGASEGYGACLGRDLEHALAMALIDAARVAGTARAQIETFLHAQADALAAADQLLTQQVGATRVEMETF